MTGQQGNTIATYISEFSLKPFHFRMKTLSVGRELANG